MCFNFGSYLFMGGPYCKQIVVLPSFMVIEEFFFIIIIPFSVENFIKRISKKSEEP